MNAARSGVSMRHDEQGSAMSKKTRKRKSRRKHRANHGHRPS
ncbi:hypothetical protein [Embleya sp. AB8]